MFGHGFKGDVILFENFTGLKRDTDASCPSVEGMDDDDIELVFRSVFKKLAEDRSFVNGVDVSGFSLFPVDLDGFPSMAFTGVVETSFLGVKGMSFDLRSGRDPDICDSSHPLGPPFFRAAIDNAISARVEMKF
jgi:hypothetical protein